MHDLDTTFSLPEAQVYLEQHGVRVGRHRLAQAARDGEVESVKFGGRWMFEMGALDALIGLPLGGQLWTLDEGVHRLAAKGIDISTTTLRRWATGQPPRPDSVLQLHRVLGRDYVDRDELYPAVTVGGAAGQAPVIPVREVATCDQRFSESALKTAIRRGELAGGKLGGTWYIVCGALDAWKERTA